MSSPALHGKPTTNAGTKDHGTLAWTHGRGVLFRWWPHEIGVALLVCRDASGEAISANTVLRTIGSSIGTAVIAALISSNVTPQGAPSDDAFTIGFWVSARVGVLALLAALVVPSRVKRRQNAEAAGIDDFDEAS